ncbi:MAG: peptidylprolyl isomerase, partial [Terriglobia bacterium]
ILNDLIDRSLLLERASDLHIQVSSTEIDARLAQIHGPVSDGSLKEEGGTAPAELRKQVEDGLIIQKLIQKEVLSRVTVTRAEITSYYAHNKTDFDVPQAEVHLAGILVTPVPDPEVRNLMRDDARNEREAGRKIEAVYLQVRTGKDFAKVAEEYSEDPRTSPGGGDMGFIPVSRFASDRALSRALKSLHPGQITGIIRDRAGFHIFKLLGRVSAGQRQLSEPAVQDAIRKTLTDEKVELLKAAYIESLRNHARVNDYLAEEILRDHGPSL